jgi:hypothetical protein
MSPALSHDPLVPLMLHTPNLFALLRHSMARVAALITPVRAALGERKE